MEGAAAHKHPHPAWADIAAAHSTHLPRLGCSIQKPVAGQQSILSWALQEGQEHQGWSVAYTSKSNGSVAFKTAAGSQIQLWLEEVFVLSGSSGSWEKHG